MLATMRSSIDYSLSKRRTLIALFQGAASAMDACDADPYLRRAAKHHGELTNRSCPVCKKLKIVEPLGINSVNTQVELRIKLS
jgi:hypothetical protein